MKILLLILTLALTPAISFASCQCICVDGKVRPVCDYNHEVWSVVCAPAVCMNGRY